MELLLSTEPASGKIVTIVKKSTAWLRNLELSREFWIFFWAAFFFDFGFAVYFFLFNLYLLDLHFNERSIGLISGAVTLGSVIGTLPAGIAARRFGLRPLLLVCFIAAPVFGVLRACVVTETAQVSLAFLAGLAMCLWGVCFLPALARTTTTENRASAFSLIFSVSIGTSTLGGLVCGYLPTWLRWAHSPMQGQQVKRLILLVACGIAAIGLIAVLKMAVPFHQRKASDQRGIDTRLAEKDAGNTPDEVQTADPRHWKLNPFLLRFLPAMGLWTVVVAAFTPFANVYLSRDLHVPLPQIGMVFSAAQVIQLLVGLMTPWLFRKFGLINGIVLTQVSTAIALISLAWTHDPRLAIGIYLAFSAMQWMSSPGLYNLVMSETPDEDRSMASSMTMFCNAVFGSAATAGAGLLFVRFGYPLVLFGIAGVALIAAAIFRLFIQTSSQAGPVAISASSPH